MSELTIPKSVASNGQTTKPLYFFDEAGGNLKELLGGKAPGSPR